MDVYGLGHVHLPYSDRVELELNDNPARSHQFLIKPFAEALRENKSSEKTAAYVMFTDHYGSTNLEEPFESGSGVIHDPAPEQLAEAGYDVEVNPKIIWAEARDGEAEIALANGTEASIEGLKGHYPIVGIPINHEYAEMNLKEEDLEGLLEIGEGAWNAHPGFAQNSDRKSREKFLEIASDYNITAGLGFSSGYPWPKINDMANTVENGNEVTREANELADQLNQNVSVFPEYDFHSAFRKKGRGLVKMPEKGMLKAKDGEVPIGEYIEGDVIETPRHAYITEIPDMFIQKYESMGDILAGGADSELAGLDKKGRRRKVNTLNFLPNKLGFNIFPTTEKQYQKQFKNSLDSIRLLGT